MAIGTGLLTRFRNAFSAAGYVVRSSDAQADSAAPTITSGSGAPTASEPVNSLYIRTDSTDAGAWLYRATDSVGTWETSVDAEIAELLAAAQTWALTQTFTTAALLPDAAALKFGTPGTDLLLTANGTDVVVTGTGGLIFADDVELWIGTGKDLVVAHDGTNTTITSATGDLVIDNTDTNDQIIVRVGTDTTATGIEFRNNSDAAIWAINPTSASAGTLKGVDGSALVLGTGDDDNIAHDGTGTLWTHTTGSLVIDSTDVNDPVVIRLGTDTTATGLQVRNDSDAAMLTVDGAGGVTVADGASLNLRGQGGGTGDSVMEVGAATAEALKLVVYDATVSPSAVETNLINLPAGSMILSVQSNVQTALTGGGTTVTYSIGTAADPDKYGSAGFNSITGAAAADALTQNAKTTWFGDGSHAMSLSGAAEQLVLTGAATGGAADGNTALTVGSVRVRVVYYLLQALANA